MIEDFYPKNHRFTTGGSIRVIPIELPTVRFVYPKDVKANSTIKVLVNIQDYQSINLELAFISETNKETFDIYLSSEEFVVDIRAPSSSGKYKLVLLSNSAYIFNNQDINVYD